MSAPNLLLREEHSALTPPAIALWADTTALVLPQRLGDRPMTRKSPHTQVNQRPSWHAVERVYSAAVALAGVQARPTVCGPQGTMALRVASHLPAGDESAFLFAREFAHFHPLPHGSVHLTLPDALREEAITAGWAEPHPIAGHAAISPRALLVYAPRTPAEGDVVTSLVRASWEMATGVRS